MFAPRAGVQDVSRVVDIGRTTGGSGFDNMTRREIARRLAVGASRGRSIPSS